MDALLRRRRRLLDAIACGSAIALLLGLGACVRRGNDAVGQSSRPRGGASASDAGVDGAIDGTASIPDAYRTSFKKVNRARFVSQGHAPGRFEVDVYANEIAEAALAARSRQVPVGAIVVAEHTEKGKPGPTMVMEKKEKGFSPEHGDWRYVSVASSGELRADGVPAQCAGCHDDSPMDGLFPIVE